jgi:hypothetical protein
VPRTPDPYVCLPLLSLPFVIAKHSMTNMSAVDCTRMCVKAGQAFALVVGDKTYNLRGDSADLDKYAAQKVTVKGKLKGNTLAVDSVAPAK